VAAILRHLLLPENAGRGALGSLHGQNNDYTIGSNVRRPTTLSELAFHGPQSLRGGKSHLFRFFSKQNELIKLRVRHQDLAHHYSEAILKQRQRVMQRDKIIIALRLVSAIGAIGRLCFYSYPLMVWLMLTI
jgi:hypothetical protein